MIVARLELLGLAAEAAGKAPAFRPVGRTEGNSYSPSHTGSENLMTDQADVLAQLSNALAARVAAVRGAIVAIRLPGERHLTGTLWQPDVVVASEQSLPKRNEFELIMPGGFAQGATVSAKVAGRDPGTNIALLRLAQPVSLPPLVSGPAEAGALALAFGADGVGGTSVRMGAINQAGPEWTSSAGGRIDQRIVLDIRLARAEEGGPVLNAAGARLGITTFGPRAEVLVIPAATIERIVPLLLKDGRIARGWLGVALQPVAVPDALRETADQSSGLMVMSVVEGGPGAQAGIVAGDIILSVDGISTHRFRKIAGYFGPDNIGCKANLRLIRGGTVITVQTTIAERPAA